MKAFAISSIYSSIACGISYFVSTTSPVLAQTIVPDNTLPNNSVVTPNGNTLTITGGTAAGTNLFHSFSSFNVPTGGTAWFNNDAQVQNILTRVTGNSISNIDGLIRANGNANLFLINPNGIIFGSGASLNIGGSFVASTASSVKFPDGREFSATNPTAEPLLTINVPIGLQFGANPGSIVNQSRAETQLNLPPLPLNIPITNQVGLAVLPGQTLALVGGDIQLDGGNLTASTGQILLGSIKSPSFVGFIPTPLGLTLNYDNIQNFGNIQLSNGSLINTSGLGGGKVDIRGSNVTLNDARIYGVTLGNIAGRGIDINAQQLRIQDGSQISTLAAGDGAGGNVNIRATDSVEMRGIGFDRYQQFIAQYLASGTSAPFDPNIVLVTGTIGTGNAGEIKIETESLLLRDGAIAVSNTLGAGNAGNLTINANVIEMVGSTMNNGTLRGSTGSGGDISITTERLTVRDGATLGSISNSTGAAGNINIKAAESVEVLRTLPGTVVQTLIGTSALDPNGIGTGGDITIDTKRLIAADGAGITTSSGGIIGETVLSTAGGAGGNLTIRATESVEVTGISGVLANGSPFPSFFATQSTTSNRGGDIYISTPALILRDGGVISTASLGAADAGDIMIDAGRIEAIGSGGNGRLISKIEASLGIIVNVSNPIATGKAGSVNLNAEQLIIRDQATVTVQALGTGQAGRIHFVGNAITLDNKGNINASTGSGTGGNIDLQARNILLRRGGFISTDADNTQGGNIKINTDFLVAVSQENSDITANAQQGAGGRVIIAAKGIFGTQFRDRLTPLSDITATSELGAQFKGIVQINTPEINPNAGLVQLPKDFSEASNQITQTCLAQARTSSFVITGRGGLPPTPDEALNSTPGWIDWRVGERRRGEWETRGRGERRRGEWETRGRGERRRGEWETRGRGERGRGEWGTRGRGEFITHHYPSPITHYQIVEATGWVVDADGTVELVAASTPQEASNKQYTPNCQTIPQ